MHTNFLSKSITIIFLLLVVFQRIIQTKPLAKHRKFVKRELNDRAGEIEERENQTTPNITRRRFQRHYDRYCGSRLRTKVAKVCHTAGYYATEESRVTNQRSTREILIRIPRNIINECCTNECSDASILKYCKAASSTNITSTTTETPHTLPTVPTVTESNSVDVENQINLESLDSTGTGTRIRTRSLIIITDPPDYNIFAINQQTNDALNY